MNLFSPSLRTQRSIILRKCIRLRDYVTHWCANTNWHLWSFLNSTGMDTNFFVFIYSIKYICRRAYGHADSQVTLLDVQDLPQPSHFLFIVANYLLFVILYKTRFHLKAKGVMKFRLCVYYICSIEFNLALLCNFQQNS